MKYRMVTTFGYDEDDAGLLARFERLFPLEFFQNTMLLVRRGGSKDAKRLATRAYLKASYDVGDSYSQQAYRQKAGSALQMQTGSPLTPFSQLPLEESEASFRPELAEAEARDFYAASRRAFVADSLAYNWSIQLGFLSNF